MNKNFLEKYFSIDRVNRYMLYYPNNEAKAVFLYKANIKLSEALYTPLSVLEVTLRNKITIELEHRYNNVEWYSSWYQHPTMRFAWPEINNTIKNLHEDGKSIIPANVIPNLMFGFWTSLFNDRYERELWANLRFVFPNMPKSIRQRKNISAPLNDIRRTLRNRVYHNEPIIFNSTQLQSHYDNILKLLEWMGTELLDYNKSIDRFPITFMEIKEELNNM